jgi:hypothetical protein
MAPDGKNVSKGSIAILRGGKMGPFEVLTIHGWRSL